MVDTENKSKSGKERFFPLKSEKKVDYSYHTILKTEKIIKTLLNEINEYEKKSNTENERKKQILIAKDSSFSFLSDRKLHDENAYIQLENQRKEIEDYKKNLQEMSKLYSDTENEVNTKNKAIEEKENKLKSLESLINDSKNEVLKKDDLIRELENEISSLKKKNSKYYRLLYGGLGIGLKDDVSIIEDYMTPENNQNNRNEGEEGVENPNLITHNSNIKENKLVDKNDLVKKIKSSINEIQGIGKFSAISNIKGIGNILNYLELKDLICMKNSCNYFFNNESLKTNIYSNLKNYISEKIKNKKLKFRDFKFLLSEDKSTHDSIINDFCLNENEEKLIPGVKLRNQILICLNFMERNVKIPLGVESQLNTSSTIIKPETQKNKSNESGFSLIGSFKNMINQKGGKSNNATVNTQQGIPSSMNQNLIQNQQQNEKKRFSLFDNDIKNTMLLEHLSKLNIQFDYTTPEEMISLLNKVHSEGFTPDFLKEFHDELFKQFSFLLFYSHLVLHEIKRLDLNKEILLENYFKTNKLLQEQEEEIEHLRSYNKTSKEIKEILSNQKTALEIKYSSLKTNLICLEQDKEELKIQIMQEKEYNDKLKFEFEVIKNKLVKEYYNIKKMYDYLKLELSEHNTKILDFKKFVFKLNITEDGEILFIEI